MARNADIRVWLSSVLPTEDLTVITSVLKDIITQAETLAEDLSVGDGAFEIRILDHTESRASFELQVVNKDKFSILPHDETYFMGDVKKALEEFTYQETISEVGIPFFIDNYFTQMDNNTVQLLGGAEEVGKLGGRVHAAIMKRFYNWGRCGHANPIIVNHVVNDKTLATVTIPKLGLHETTIADFRYIDLSSGIKVTTKDETVYKGKFTTFIKQAEHRKLEELYKEEYQLVKKIIEDIPVNRYPFDQYYLLSQMVGSLSIHTSTLEDGIDEVNLAIDKCRWNLIGEATYKDNEFLIDLTMTNTDPTKEIHYLTDHWKQGAVSLSKLIAGLNVYRQVHSVPNPTWSVGSFSDHAVGQFLAHREVGDLLEDSLAHQGYDVETVKEINQPRVVMGDIHLLLRSGDSGLNLYALEHHNFSTVYIFDEIYNLKELTLPEPKLPEVKEPMNLGFFNIFRGLVTMFSK